MKELVEAFNIFLKYRDVTYPTGCEHDVLYVYGIKLDEVSDEDVARLDELGFFWDEDLENWQSFRYGSA